MKTNFRFLAAAVVAIAAMVVVLGLDWSGDPGDVAEVQRGEKPATPPLGSLAGSRPRSAEQPGRSRAAELGDPDKIGACPKAHSPVVRRGLDSSGQPTWWHADGSMTVRVRQGYTAPDGQRRMIGRIVVVRPAEARPDPDK